jgi:hypothetical protein
MSEYQYIAFRAIDAPVSKQNLKFMHQQSSRAEITPRSFDNEYHFGDFGGDAEEMLRRGYDFHLHYANFGIRKLMIRLPHGLPDPKAAAPYLEEESLSFVKDKRGPGGILRIDPYSESGELDELWDLDDYLDNLLPLRAEILEGDLRPLYLAHLVVAGDDNHDPEETQEGPVPAGLGKVSAAQRTLAEFYGLGNALMAAAAQNSPALPTKKDSESRYAAWLQRQPEATKNTWLAQLLANPESAARREILAEFQKSRSVPSWPTARSDRTIAELRTAAEEVQSQKNQRDAEKALRQRTKKLAAMAADPTPTLRETERLVMQRSTASYEQIAGLLVDLREALAGSPQSSLAEEQARKLTTQNPTLKMLTGQLRRKGFLKK